MYFNAEAQAGIVQRLHFALKPRGYLFLGKAEMLFTQLGSFRPVDLKRRVFAGHDAARRTAGRATRSCVRAS
jgi:two-component system CheB/CheR fusion protein